MIAKNKSLLTKFLIQLFSHSNIYKNNASLTANRNIYKFPTQIFYVLDT